MFGILRKVALLFAAIAVALSLSAFSYVQMGGEIPWPLSIQHAVTVQNSKGLWRLGDGQQSRLFNVEMRADSRSGFDWIRVSELHPESYEVISWGEGYFSPTAINHTESSYSNVNLETGIGKKDSRGRYITMYTNGDLTDHPYMIRLVEVETTLGNVLGLSILEYVEKSFDHLLGTRVMVEPLSCVEGDKDGLTCYLGL